MLNRVNILGLKDMGCRVQGGGYAGQHFGPPVFQEYLQRLYSSESIPDD